MALKPTDRVRVRLRFSESLEEGGADLGELGRILERGGFELVDATVDGPILTVVARWPSRPEGANEDDLADAMADAIRDPLSTVNQPLSVEVASVENLDAGGGSVPMVLIVVGAVGLLGGAALLAARKNRDRRQREREVMMARAMGIASGDTPLLSSCGCGG